MGYRLIVLDIDGTLQSREHALTGKTRRALARVMESGAVVTLATGRMFRSARRFAVDVNITAPIASSQGAHVADPITQEVLRHLPLTEPMAMTALEALEPWGMEVVGYLDDQVYATEKTEWVASYGQWNGVQVEIVDDLRQYAGRGLTRLLAVGDEGEIRRLDLSLNAAFEGGLYVTRSLPHFCEILHPDGGKDKALSWLCTHLGIGQDETVSFGNGFNDVPMVRWAGLGVAVGGAVSEVLAVAAQVAPNMEEDGAAQVLEGLLERGLIG